MIRPITILCAMAFAGSGFYMYQAKHHSQVVDRKIVKTMKAVDEAHNRALLLRAEYALLNDPERLQQLADQYLNLKPTAPTQFVAMADLERRLPPVGVAPVAPPPVEPDAPAATLPKPPADMPIANAAPPAAVPPASPAAKPVAVAVAPQAPARIEPARIEPPRPSVLAAARPVDSPVQSVALVRPLPRRAEPGRTDGVAGAPLRPIVLHPPALSTRVPQIASAPPAYVRPSAGDTPFEQPHYAPAAVAYRAPAPSYATPTYRAPYQAPYRPAAPVAYQGGVAYHGGGRPMVGSALGMARSMPGYAAPGGDGR